MIGLSPGTRIWIVAGVTDMRRGFVGLAGMVQTALEENPFSGQVFVFRGRRGDLIKVLWWDGDGLCLFAKRLERGRFIWPQATSGVVSLTPAQLSMLLEDTVEAEGVPLAVDLAKSGNLAAVVDTADREDGGARSGHEKTDQVIHLPPGVEKGMHVGVAGNAGHTNDVPGSVDATCPTGGSAEGAKINRLCPCPQDCMLDSDVRALELGLAHDLPRGVDGNTAAGGTAKGAEVFGLRSGPPHRVVNVAVTAPETGGARDLPGVVDGSAVTESAAECAKVFGLRASFRSTAPHERSRA